MFFSIDFLRESDWVGGARERKKYETGPSMMVAFRTHASEWDGACNWSVRALYQESNPRFFVCGQSANHWATQPQQEFSLLL